VLRSSIVIATFRRPEELTLALRSILLQTRLPHELIVVDDGELEELPLQDLFDAAGVRTHYHRKTGRGLPESRNIGVDLATGDVILFLDDDVALFPDYVAEVLKVFESDQDGEIAGVGGREANLIRPMSWRSRLRRLRDILFLMGGFSEGRVLPSGYCTEYGSPGRPITELTDVDFLVGATSAYRKTVFREERFSEGYPALGEDKDFSYRVSRRHRVVINPNAMLFHSESPTARANRRNRGYQGVLGRYLFFRRYLLTSPWHWVFFAYALCGHLLSRALIALVTKDLGDREQFHGMLAATRDIVAGRAAGADD